MHVLWTKWIAWCYADIESICMKPTHPALLKPAYSIHVRIPVMRRISEEVFSFCFFYVLNENQSVKKYSLVMGDSYQWNKWTNLPSCIFHQSLKKESTDSKDCRPFQSACVLPGKTVIRWNMFVVKSHYFWQIII